MTGRYSWRSSRIDGLQWPQRGHVPDGVHVAASDPFCTTPAWPLNNPRRAPVAAVNRTVEPLVHSSLTPSNFVDGLLL
jgi:hypothetical protein